MQHIRLLSVFVSALAVLAGCGGGTEPLDPNTAPVVSVDRFSAEAGHLMVRDATNGLPEANAPIDFDEAPFITRGLGPNGEMVAYYNFDVQPLEAAPIFALFREGASAPVEGQLNIIDVIPGEAGYSDLWHVHKVTVPEDYVANTLTNVADVMASGYEITPTDLVVNCPVVPDGSTATMRLSGDPGLVSGWYRDQVVKYFTFETLNVTPPAMGHPLVPTSPIYVTFNVNPDQAGGGPASGFVTEMNSMQTHNVVATLPGDAGYSPLWLVNVYDNMDFAAVMDLMDLDNATVLAEGVADVNCPIVSVP